MKLSAMTAVTMTFCCAFVYYLSFQEYLYVSLRIIFQDFHRIYKHIINRIRDNVFGVLTSLWAGSSTVRFSTRAREFSLPASYSIHIGGGGGQQLGHASYLSPQSDAVAENELIGTSVPLTRFHAAHTDEYLQLYIYHESSLPSLAAYLIVYAPQYCGMCNVLMW
jgi:hypothetical protein